MTTLDLFADAWQRASPIEYAGALEAWIADGARSGRLRRDSSASVYESMWSAMAAWAVANGLGLDTLSAEDLERYLRSRGGSNDLSHRYSWRLVRLVDRVLAHRARSLGLPLNSAVANLLATHPEIRYANAAGEEPLPEYLDASEAKRLVTYLSAVRPGRGTAGQAWQEIRNRASIALMLGGGLTPGEVRALELDDVIVDGGRARGVPWKLRIAGSGSVPARETPVAPWAGQLLAYWLDVRAEQGIPGQMVFPSTRSTGKGWGKVTQYNAAREVLAAAGIDDVAGGSFRLRHTFALRQLRRGKSLEDVGRWLGVSDPSVMSRYQRVLSAPIDDVI